MGEIAIDLELIERGDGRNPFDALASSLERLSLAGDNTFDREGMEKTLLFLERKAQDFAESDQLKCQVITEAVNATMLMFESSDTSKNISNLYENLERIKEMSISLGDMNDTHTKSMLLSNFIRKRDSDNKGYSTSIVNSTLSQFLENYSEANVTAQEDWVIEMNFETNDENKHEPLEFIHTFVSALNLLDGVKVTLEDVEVGSIKAKLKAVFDDVKSKDEFKELMESTRKFAKGKLEKEYLEGERLSSEVKKNIAETQVLEEKLDAIRSDEGQELIKVENETAKVELERKKLENEKMKLDLFKQRKDLIRELLAEGIIDQRNFEILIKGIPFLKMQNGSLTIGENLDIIDGM